MVTGDAPLGWLRRQAADRRVRAAACQLLFAAALAGLGLILVSNVQANLERQSLSFGFGFLEQESGFALSQSVLPYSAADSYGRAFLAGLVNTLSVATVGILLAVVLGIVLGLARLSSNWLLAKLTGFYVEAMRNIPLLLHLFLWYSLLTSGLPSVQHAIELLPGVFISNRGIVLPTLEPNAAWPAVACALVVGAAIALMISRLARRPDRARLLAYPQALIWLFLAGLPLLVYLLWGAPTALEVPQLEGFNFVGGVTLRPELLALLLGLVIYTAAFIAEITRSGILAVSKGQLEAGYALDLSRGLVLRLVLLPQAMKVIIPPLASQCLNLLKNSSLAVAIGYPDLVSVVGTTINQSGRVIEAMLILTLVYLTICLAIAGVLNWWNIKLNPTESGNA